MFGANVLVVEPVSFFGCIHQKLFCLVAEWNLIPGFMGGPFGASSS